MGGGGWRGVPVGLPQDQAAHPPTQADPPTHPPRPPPTPPPVGGGGGVLLCCKNQLVTQKLCVFGQKKLCHSVSMPSLRRGVAEPVVTLVVDHCAVDLGHGTASVRFPLAADRKILSLFTTVTGKFCHFLQLFSQ